MSFNLQAIETTAVTPVTTLEALSFTTAPAGWVLEFEYTSAGRTCPAANVNGSNINFVPMDVCEPKGDKTARVFTCDADKNLVTNRWSDAAWNQCSNSATGVEQKCNRKDELNTTCELSGETHGEKVNCTNPIDLGTVADFAACVAACKADSTCVVLHMKNSTKKCEGFTSACNEDKTDDDDYTVANPHAKDRLFLADCSAGAVAPVAGGQITEWYPGKNADGSDKTLTAADCATKTSDKDSDNAGPRNTYGFVFDKCVPKTAENESWVVHCNDNKVYYSKYYYKTDCNGIPDESTEIKKTCTLTKDNKNSYTATWWGQCDGVAVATAQVTDECVQEPGCSLKEVCDELDGGPTPEGTFLSEGNTQNCGVEAAKWEVDVPCADISQHFVEHPDVKKSVADGCCAGEKAEEEASSAPSKFMLVAVFGSLFTALVSAL